MNCQDFSENLALYDYAELRGDERAALEDHLAGCEQCRKVLEQSRRLADLLSQQDQAELVGSLPSLLVECRQHLEIALDREQTGWRALLRAWLPPVAAAHPARAMTALTLVALGFSLGWLLRPRTETNTLTPGPVTNTSPAQMAVGDLGNARINSISQVAPDPETGDVKITLNAERRVTMEGSLDNPNIRQVMLYALKSYDNPGIRLDTLNALRKGGVDPAVRDVLLYTLEHDPNAGVRLQALRNVTGASWDSDIAHGFLQAAEKDPNLGVREAAIDSLVSHVSSEDGDDLIPALQHLASEDSDRYVRIKALAALREMGQ
ncbi:MAG TPA: HEAT repeat domain-containing protein [Terriglobia bacterium]|nr:HEAT repeat domain-containing protein [Terriglobia bacterium]